MRSRLRLLLRFALLWVILQQAGRFLFLAYQHYAGQTLPWGEVWGSALRGLRMDASLTGYFLALVSLLLALLCVLRDEALRKVVLWVNGGLTVLCVGLTVADFELFRNWQSRIDITPFLYLENPAEALASTPIWIYGLLILAITLWAWGFLWLAGHWVWPRRLRLPFARWWYPLVLLLFAGSMILPIRGSLSVAPMNAGSVAFSKNTFANQAAVNPVWNVVHDFLARDQQYVAYPALLDSSTTAQRFRSLMEMRDTLRDTLLRCARPNIILVLMESQSARFSSVVGHHSAMPRFDSLCQEGVVFTRTYAAGLRSDKGIVGVLAGYPAQAKKSIIKYTRKLQKLSFLPNALDSVGYNSTFYYGGDANFTNMRTCLYTAGFKRIVDVEEFPKDLGNSKWGVHDEYMYKRMLREIDTARHPYFKMLFTLTNHEPFELPHRENTGSDEELIFATARYADSCLGDFVDQLRHRADWDSTLVIVLADHAHRYPDNILTDESERYHIPQLWVGGALRDSLTRRQTCVMSQIDVAATLLGQMGLPHSQFPFSRDALRAQHSGAMVVYNNGFGWVSDSAFFIHDHDTQRTIPREGGVTDSLTEAGFAFFLKASQHYNGL